MRPTPAAERRQRDTGAAPQRNGAVPSLHVLLSDRACPSDASALTSDTLSRRESSAGRPPPRALLPHPPCRMTQRLSAVLAVALWVTVGATADPVTPPLVAPLAAEQRPKAHLTHRFLQQASDLGLWSGTIACSDTAEGISVYYKVRLFCLSVACCWLPLAHSLGRCLPSDTAPGNALPPPRAQDAFGMASHELGVPLRPELRMPIGSTTKVTLVLQPARSLALPPRRRCRCSWGPTHPCRPTLLCPPVPPIRPAPLSGLHCSSHLPTARAGAHTCATAVPGGAAAAAAIATCAPATPPASAGPGAAGLWAPRAQPSPRRAPPAACPVPLPSGCTHRVLSARCCRQVNIPRKDKTSSSPILYAGQAEHQRPRLQVSRHDRLWAAQPLVPPPQHQRPRRAVRGADARPNAGAHQRHVGQRQVGGRAAAPGGWAGTRQPSIPNPLAPRPPAAYPPPVLSLHHGFCPAEPPCRTARSPPPAAPMHTLSRPAPGAAACSTRTASLHTSCHTASPTASRTTLKSCVKWQVGGA